MQKARFIVVISLIKDEKMITFESYDVNHLNKIICNVRKYLNLI